MAAPFSPLFRRRNVARLTHSLTHALGLLAQPAHHTPELGTDLFDAVLLLGLADLVEVLAASLEFPDPLLREPATLNGLELTAHPVLDRLVDNLRSNRDVPILRGLRLAFELYLLTTFSTKGCEGQ